MTYWAILCGFVLFLIGFIGHALWWRTARPVDDIRALGLSLLVAPMLTGAAFLFAFPQQTPPREMVASVFVAFAIGAIYIMWYPAAQAASPTMLLVLQIAREAPQGGASRGSLREAFDDELLCRQSISNLIHERFAGERDGKLFVAARGSFLLRMLNSWRSFLGLKYGSG